MANSAKFNLLPTSVHLKPGEVDLKSKDRLSPIYFHRRAAKARQDSAYGKVDNCPETQSHAPIFFKVYYEEEQLTQVGYISEARQLIQLCGSR